MEIELGEYEKGSACFAKLCYELFDQMAGVYRLYLIMMSNL